MDAAGLLGHRYAMIALKKGLVTRDQFELAMKKQRQGDAGTLWDILIKIGAITEKQKQYVLPISMNIKTKSAPEPEKTDKDRSGQSKKQSDPDLAAADKEKKTEKSSDIAVAISDDKMTASILVKEGKHDGITVEAIKRVLSENKITSGINEDHIIRNKLKNLTDKSGSFEVAKGTPVEPGTPDTITYHFEINPFRIGTIKEDGTMDWKERGRIPLVSEGDLIAEIVPGKAGKPGKNVYGRVLSPNPGKKIRLKAGKGVKVSENRLEFFAAVKGQPKLISNQELGVFQTLDINGDVGVKTGHIDFDGHIEVKDSIQKGYTVKGQSLKVREILSESVEIKGDIFASEGMFGAVVRAGGQVGANHINKTKIIAGQDVVVKKEIVDSHIETSGKCILDGGTILSSTIYAKKGIIAGNIGSEAAKPSTLFVGMDQPVIRTIERLKKNVAQFREEIKKIEIEIPKLEERSDELNTSLGEIAQVQDKYIVKKNLTAEKVDNKNGKPSPEAKQLLEDLDKKIKSIDEKVSELMEEDEKTIEAIENHKKEFGSIKEKIDEFETKIEEIQEESKLDPGVAVVKASGKIYPPTEVNGPHSRITTKDIYTQAVIMEKKNQELDSKRGWQMRIFQR